MINILSILKENQINELTLDDLNKLLTTDMKKEVADLSNCSLRTVNRALRKSSRNSVSDKNKNWIVYYGIATLKAFINKNKNEDQDSTEPDYEKPFRSGLAIAD